MRPKGAPELLEEKRRRAIAMMVLQKFRQSQVALYVGVSKASVSRWVKNYRLLGEAGLAAKKGRVGRRSRLTEDQTIELKVALLQRIEEGTRAKVRTKEKYEKLANLRIDPRLRSTLEEEAFKEFEKAQRPYQLIDVTILNVVRLKFKVTYNIGHIWRLMTKRLGWKKYRDLGWRPSDLKTG